jgi:malonyl-CoA/methylmalonyl-CoA synthetase
VTDPARAATLVDALLRHPPRRPAVHGREGITYGRLAAGSAALASRLRDEYHVAPGDRIALLCEPGAPFLSALYGIWRARAAALVLTPLHTPSERLRALDDSATRLVLTSTTLATAAAHGAGDRPVATIPTLGTKAAARPTTLDPVRSDDLALVVYTSGTTSAPKGVPLHHRHLEAQVGAIAAAWAMRSDDVLVHALPLHHVHGLVIALLTTLRVGGQVALLERFDAQAVLATCRIATVFMGVPTMYARLVEALDACDGEARARAISALRRLRLCTSGSAALPVSLGERWAAYAGAFPVERFGMTELGVALSNALEERVPGSVGRPLAGVRVRVEAEGGAEADEGELLVAGPTVFDGYWRRPTETAAAFVEREGVRWFRTGDTVSRDATGRIRVVGRTSVDIIKSAGYKLGAPEIEEALRGHPLVRDAAVVGLPDGDAGQRVAAAVMLRPGATLTSDELLAFARTNLATYKLPRLVRFVDDVPRNALGKVLKPELARLLAEDAPSRTAPR